MITFRDRGLSSDPHIRDNMLKIGRIAGKLSISEDIRQSAAEL
jgi:hypothetical protein